jgi:hypothetical protein
MRLSFAVTALALVAGTTAIAQQPAAPSARPFAPTPPSANTAQKPNSADGKIPVYQDGAVIAPPPTEDNAPGITLPPEPIEPFLLSKQNGPCMVLVQTFRTPNATKYAQALAMELRREHGLAAYVFYLKIHPGTSNIYGIPPTSHPADRTGHLAAPELYRKYDEAAVLVGDCKTMADAKALCHQVKKIKPKCLDAAPSIFGFRKPSLSHATLTFNPLAGAQNMYPGRPVQAKANGEAFDPSLLAASFESMKKPDPVVQKLNTGSHSIYKCPGAYTMPVATFTGRATYDTNDARFDDVKFLKKSPLAQAYEDAEELAAALSKCDRLRNAGMRVYTYHERSSSRVTIGSFSAPNDPNAKKLRDDMTNIVTELFVLTAKEKRSSVIVPSSSEVLLAVPHAN